MGSFFFGDVVCVREGVLHPGLGISLAGWHGRISDILSEGSETYLGVAWDSVTLQAMPPGMAQYAFDQGWVWHGWLFSPEQLQHSPARDTPEEAAAALTAVAASLRHDWNPAPAIEAPRLAQQEMTESRPFFDLPLFLDVLHIPQAERQAVAEGLATGAGAYMRQVYGRLRYGKRPFFLIPSLMAQAYPFGFGALALLADARISLESRQRIAYFACQTTDPFAANHTPYGLITFISFLAQHNALSVALFRSVLLALELSDLPHKLAGWSLPDAQALTEWLARETSVPDEEKLWWLWYLSAHLKPGLGKKLLPWWLAHSGFSQALRRELANALRSDTPPATARPPANWRLMAATFAGDVEQAEAIAQEMNLAEEMDASEQAIMADLQRAPHIPPMPDHHGPGNDPAGFLAMLMGMRFGQPLRHPPFVRRLAESAALSEAGTRISLAAVARARQKA